MRTAGLGVRRCPGNLPGKFTQGLPEAPELSAPSVRVELVFEPVTPGAGGMEVIGMCGPQDAVSVTDVLAMLDRALAALAAADAASLPAVVQAQALQALERAEARHTAARAQFLAAFTAQDGYEGMGRAACGPGCGGRHALPRARRPRRRRGRGGWPRTR